MFFLFYYDSAVLLLMFLGLHVCSIEVQQIIQPSGSDAIYAVGFDGSSQFVAYKINARNGKLIKNRGAVFPAGFSTEMLLVSDALVVALDASMSSLVTISFQDGINFQQKYLSDLVGDSSVTATLLPLKLQEMVAVKVDEFVIFVKVAGEGNLELVDKINNPAVVSDTIFLSENQQAVALVQHGDGKIHLTVKLVHDWSNDLLKESIVMDNQRGLAHKVFVNNYIRTDRSHGFRALVVMEDHSLLLMQQGEIVWRREDGLASIVDVATSELPLEKDGVSVAKVEENLFEWLKV